MKYLSVWSRVGNEYSYMKYMFGGVSYLTAQSYVVDGSVKD